MASDSGEDGSLGVESFATHHMPLDEAPHAYADFQVERAACPRSSSDPDHPGAGTGVTARARATATRFPAIVRPVVADHS